METSQPLTIESFSYSWLINQKPSLDRVFDCDKQETNTISTTNSSRLIEEAQNFCFNLPYATNLVDADEIFCNGRIVPKSINQIKIYSCPATPAVLFSPHKKPSKKYSQLIADWRGSTKKVLRKCFSFLVPRKSTRIADSSRNSACFSSSSVVTTDQLNTRIEVYQTTFRRTKSWSHDYSTSGSHFSCSKNKSYNDYTEGSVHEAIVHCKKSLEK